VLGIVADDMLVDRVTEGDFTLITDKTPFYGEGGGQVGDIGAIYDKESLIAVTDTKKTDGVFLHVCSMANGDIQVGDTVVMEVDATRRSAIMRNHSACHLLQAALRQVLGAHVEQAGSYVDAERVRFDFSHYSAVTSEELLKVEMLVNSHILLAECVNTKETDIETARKEGAMALFGEKYGKVVRVVKMGEFSTELCGGTHVDNTGKIGLFKILSETSVAAGVRRIEGTTGLGVLSLIAEKDALIADTAKELKCPNPNDVAKRAAQVQGELKAAKGEIESLQAKIASGKLDAIRNGAKTIGAVKLMAARVEGASVDAVRGLCDNIRAEDASSVVVIALVNEGKLNFVASCGADAVKSGANAGKLVKEAAVICGGGGGGRPDSAMAGGKDASKVDAALAAVETALAGMLK
jgi:alanyl-tRNA synthetase